MEGIPIFFLIGFGAFLLWQRLTGKRPAVPESQRQEEGWAIGFFMLFAGAMLAFFLIGILMEIFPEIQGDLFYACIIIFIGGPIYTWAWIRFMDWVADWYTGR